MPPFEDTFPMVVPPSSSPSTSRLSVGERCAVCDEEKVNSKRYGAPACLGCVVFFRRAIVNRLNYKCLRNRNCSVVHEYRCSCRYCRLQKCFKVGMKPESIQRRDLVGPRKPININGAEFSPDFRFTMSPEIVGTSENLLRVLVEFQRQQTSQHLSYFAAHSSNSSEFSSGRRARAHDVNVMLKLCLTQAADWGKHFKPFRRLPEESKKSILAEYGFAFLLIDQGFKTANEAEDGFWLLQNGTFMHTDYFYGLPEEDAKKENVELKAEFHKKFVSELLNCVSRPFRRLQIDEVECAALKVVLLLTPSFSRRAIYSGQEGAVAAIHTKCMKELMEHSLGAERFGEILLLISSIRCGVKALYNQTRVSDVFSLMQFDPFVRDILLC